MPVLSCCSKILSKGRYTDTVFQTCCPLSNIDSPQRQVQCNP